MEIMVKLDIMTPLEIIFLLIFPCCLNVSLFMEKNAKGKCANALFWTIMNIIFHDFRTAFSRCVPVQKISFDGVIIKPSVLWSGLCCIWSVVPLFWRKPNAHRVTIRPVGLEVMSFHYRFSLFTTPPGCVSVCMRPSKPFNRHWTESTSALCICMHVYCRKIDRWIWLDKCVLYSQHTAKLFGGCNLWSITIWIPHVSCGCFVVFTSSSLREVDE